MSDDLYIRRFEEALADVWVRPSLQTELDEAREPNGPAMSTDEFRRGILAEFSALLDRERQRNPNVELNTVAAMAVSAFAKRFSPAPDAEEDSVLSETVQHQLREIFDGIMARAHAARFKDPNAAEMAEHANVITFGFGRKR